MNHIEQAIRTHQSSSRTRLKTSCLPGWTATSHPDAFQLLLPRWAVPQGARVAILGAVGSGKSSLLAMLLGEMAMQKGSVALMPGENRIHGYREVGS